MIPQSTDHAGVLQVISDIKTCDVPKKRDLLRRMKAWTLGADSSVTGFNIGMNAGDVEGQTIFRCHMHLIPRRKGDVSNPRGGLRHLIPGNGSC